MAGVMSFAPKCVAKHFYRGNLECCWRRPGTREPRPKTLHWPQKQPIRVHFSLISRPIRLQVLPRGNTPRQLFPDLTETDVVSFFSLFHELFLHVAENPRCWHGIAWQYEPARVSFCLLLAYWGGCNVCYDDVIWWQRLAWFQHKQDEKHARLFGDIVTSL